MSPAFTLGIKHVQVPKFSMSGRITCDTICICKVFLKVSNPLNSKTKCPWFTFWQAYPVYARQPSHQQIQNALAVHLALWPFSQLFRLAEWEKETWRIEIEEIKIKEQSSSSKVPWLLNINLLVWIVHDISWFLKFNCTWFCQRQIAW